MTIRGRRFVLPSAIVIVSVAAIFLVLGARAVVPDSWSHVRFGQPMRDSGFIPRQDSYAYTEVGWTWINHEWFAGWLFGWIFDMAGSWVLVVLKLLFVAGVYSLPANHRRRRGAGNLLAAIMLQVPRVNVSTEGGRETVYPDSVYQAFLVFQSGEGDWSRHLETPPSDLALVTRAGPAANLLEPSSGWSRQFGGSVGALYVDDDVPVAHLPKAYERPGPGQWVLGASGRWCFPA